MDNKTIKEMQELAKSIFESAAALVGYFARDEAEARRLAEELKKRGKAICFTFQPLKRLTM